MNMTRNQRDNPRTIQNTNLAGGRGHGCIPGLGIKKFIDELFTRVDSSTRDRYQGPSYVRRISVSPRLEALV